MKTAPITCAIILLLTISVFSQERSTIQMNYLKDTELVEYSNDDVVIAFRKSDLLYKLEQMGPLTETEKKVISFLKTEKKIAVVEGKEKASSANELLLQLLKDKLAGGLLTGGDANVTRKSDKKKQMTIMLESEGKTATGNRYIFLFNDGKPFFTAETPYTIAFAQQEETAVAEDISVNYEEAVGVEQVSDDMNTIFTIVEQQPEPPQGMTDFIEYINKNLKYPKKAKKEGIEGSVFVSFVVETNGTLTDFNTIKGLSSECDQEAIRLIKGSGTWKPGKQNGVARRVRYVLPVKFKLESK